jgi:hypothetical protein
MLKKLFRSNLRPKDDDGYVLITVLGICFLAVVIVSSITAITISDLVFNARVRAVIEAKHSAESVMDAYYVSLNATRNEDAKEASAAFVSSADERVVPAAWDLTSLGFVNGVEVMKTEFSPKWFSIDDEGVIQDCGAEDNSGRMLPCFKMRLIRSTTRVVEGNVSLSTGDVSVVTDVEGDNIRREYSAEIVVRHMCLNNSQATNPQGCVFSRFQQQIRQREFVRHVVMSETEEIDPDVADLAPAALVPSVLDIKNNSYANNDSVSGNVHTNGESVYTCDSFNITGYVTASPLDAGSAIGSAAKSDSGFTDCSTASPNVFSAVRSAYSLPTRSQDTDGTRLKTLARTENATLYDLAGDQNIVFDGKTMSLDGVNFYPLPSFGVVYVDGNATVSGVLDGKVTVYSTGNITVGTDLNTNLEYADSDPTTSDDLLGLLTNNDIILHCKLSGTQCEEKKVHGLLRAGGLATGGTIFNPRWATAVKSSGDAPILNLLGSMISGYRGTFGSMNSSDAGEVTAGWRKEFNFDPRLRFEQPPYMLRDSLSMFIRSSMRDVPCVEDSDARSVCVNSYESES